MVIDLPVAFYDMLPFLITALVLISARCTHQEGSTSLQIWATTISVKNADIASQKRVFRRGGFLQVKSPLFASAANQSQFTLKMCFPGWGIPPRTRGGGGAAPRPRNFLKKIE